ncbi:MAG: transposase [Planctomycetota bacterium]
MHDSAPLLAVSHRRVDAHDEDTRLGVSTSFTQHPALRSTTLLRTVLAIQSISVRGSAFDDFGLIVDVAPTWSIPRCGDCGGPAHSVHDQRERYWRHLDGGGMFVKLRYAIRRVVGRHLDGGEDRLEGLRHIGIDELSYRRHHQYVTVVIDHERGVVVWSQRGKSADTLKACFKDLGPERCKLIESATIDMSGAYISAVGEMIPDAKMIFDRFHVQRLVQNALDETRRDEVREAPDTEGKKALKNTRWWLLKSPWNLTDTESMGLEGLEEANKWLSRGYLLKGPLQGSSIVARSMSQRRGSPPGSKMPKGAACLTSRKWLAPPSGK